MNSPLLTALWQNAAMLLALVVLFDLFSSRQRWSEEWRGQFLAGLVAGILGIGLVTAAYPVEPGIIFDTRSVLLSVCGLFLGPLPTLVAAVLTAAARLLVGGVAALPGVLVIGATCGLGLLWRWRLRKPLHELGATELYAFGLVVHVAMLLVLLLTLSDSAAQRVLPAITLPVMLIYPVATAGLGWLLVNRLQRARRDAALAASEARFRHIVQGMPLAVLIVRLPDYVVEYANARAEQLFGLRLDEVLGTPSLRFYADPADAARTRARLEREGRVESGEIQLLRANGERFWAVVSSVLTRDERGPMTLSAITDITARKQAEEARRESERQLRTLLSNLPGVAYRCRNDPSWTMQFISDGVFDLTGYPAEDLVGNRRVAFGDLIHPEDRQAVWIQVQACLQRREPYVLNYRLRTAGGEERWVWEKGQGIFDGQDQLQALEGFITDITPLKQTEAALERERRLLRTLVDHLPVAVYSKDIAGRKTLANRQELRILGCETEEEALGKTDLDFYPRNEALRFMADDQRVMQSGQPVLERELWLTRPDGARACFAFSKVPLVDGEGRVTGLVGISLDITERKRAEEALRESEALFRALTEESLTGVYLIQDRRFQYVNRAAARMLGRPVEELLAIPDVLEVVAEADRPRVQENMRRRLAGEVSALRYEFAVLLPEGGQRLLEVVGTATTYRGRPAILSTAQDITERKRAEEALRAALKEKTVLLREVHHRVKNNLQIISSLVHLQADQWHHPELRPVLEQTQRRIRSMALLHEALYHTEDLARVDLARYTRSLCDLLRRTLGADTMERVQVHLEVAELSLGLEQAVPCGLLINELVSNALKHAFPAGRRGHIRVRVSITPTGEAELDVSDDGIGLPPQVDPDRTQTLGLQLVQILTRQLHGRLAIRRTPGTGFQITFPIANSLPVV